MRTVPGYSRAFTVLILISCIFFTAFSIPGPDDKYKSLRKTDADVYVMQINNLSLPITNTGTIGQGAGVFDEHIFFYAGGFYLSGKSGDNLWVSRATYDRINDYVPGTIKGGRGDGRAKLYVINKSDGDFAQSWLNWSEAVELGADFYDGYPDGEYVPEDRNGNGRWDADEDCPDLLGDQTVWCVYNDGLESTLRLFPGQEPQGIEIRQTVFGYASSGPLGNVVFIRYRILNTGVKSEVLDSVYFGVWADPDLGWPVDDLVGCDTSLNAGFIYNYSSDSEYGNNPPCFLIDFFQGPAVFVPGVTFRDNNYNGFYDDGEEPIESAHTSRGRIGDNIIPGARNIGISSFVNFVNGHPAINDPDDATEARYFMEGLQGTGEKIDPCNWNMGRVRNDSCEKINPYFWYSGDPVTNKGWINTYRGDARIMQNTGPFRLQAGRSVDIVVAYIVGRGTNPLASITEAKKNSALAQYFYDNNFVDPPDPDFVEPQISTTEGLIDIVWETSTQVNFKTRTPAWNLAFEGYNVYAYKTNNITDVVDDHPNRKLITSYDLKNFIGDIYKQDFLTGAVYKKFPRSSDDHQLDPKIYGDKETGKIRLRITSDPFTGGPLIKGKPYFFAITSYTLDYDNLFNRSGAPFGTNGDYVISSASIKTLNESTPVIFTATVGEDIYSPPVDLINAGKAQGPSSGTITYDVIEKDALSGHSYKVEFMTDSLSAEYNALWRLTDETTGEIKIDSCSQYLWDKTAISSDILTDGFILRVKKLTPKPGTARFISDDNSVNNFSLARATGAYYMGKDIRLTANQVFAGGISLPAISSMKSLVKADRLRNVEIRFGEGGKAYRYLNGFFGSVIQRKGSYIYAEAVTAEDTVGKGPVGKPGEGFVDVPFTAWVVDTASKETRQLAVGFIERSKPLGGTPDGIWNPGDNIRASAEYIILFDADYDPAGGQTEYKGVTYNSKTIWADLKGYSIPKEMTGLTAYQKFTAKSAWFNALYIAGLEVKKNKNILPGSKLEIPVDVYPYTNKDVYRFNTKAGGRLSESERKELFSKVNVFPNPLFAYNPSSGYFNNNPDDPFITFSNLPEEVTVKIFTISGKLIKTLTSSDKQGGPDSPFIRWNLLNDYDLRIASGIYLAIVSSPGLGEKVLKFSVIMPQKDIQKF